MVKHNQDNDDFEDVTAIVYPNLVPALEREDIEPMTPEERKRRLARFAREDIISRQGTIHRMPAIQSIIELNKMDGSYAPQRHQHQHVVFQVRLVDRTRDQEITIKEENIVTEQGETGRKHEGTSETT